MNSHQHKRSTPFWRRKLFRRVPILSWLIAYDTNAAVCDLIAGVTVGLTVMPQSLAYATLAGLEPQVSAFGRARKPVPTTSSPRFHLAARNTPPVATLHDGYYESTLHGKTYTAT